MAYPDMTANEWTSRHGPFLVLIALLFLAALYVDMYLYAFDYILINSRLLFQLFVAVTAIAILKNVVGLKTYGTFSPAIIALAFLQAGPIFGTILLLNILVVVIATRELIRRELVQQDHRVAILIIMVGFAIIMSEILTEYYHYQQFDFSFLFPVLILAWTAERFVEGIDRTGWESSSKQLLWTFVAVYLGYAVMVQVWLVDFVTLNPLTWPLLILLNWFLGTRVRFRLSERRRFRRLISTPSTLPANEILTMNVRNQQFVSKYTDPSMLSVLTKERVKHMLSSNGVPVPETYLLLERKEDLSKLEAFLMTAGEFVVKPASGHGGEGILVIRGREGTSFRTNEGLMSPAQIVAHAQYVITGAFGDESSDRVLVEALIKQHPSMKDLVPEGLADIRVIALQGFPVMAMMRLPTKESKGRANLHGGAVGCGINLSSGKIVHATWHGRPVNKHPDTLARIIGTQVPFWNDILHIAAQAQVASGLGYAGVDIVLDDARGPLVLEVNKRPGLEIQNANNAGLLRRLRIVERLSPKPGMEERVAAAVNMDLGNWEAGPS